MIKFVYSEKATKFCEISTLHLTLCTVVKVKMEILVDFVALSEYMNFIMNSILILRCNNVFSTIFFGIRVCNVNAVTYCGTAKRILVRLGIQTSSSFVEI